MMISRWRVWLTRLDKYMERYTLLGRMRVLMTAWLVVVVFLLLFLFGLNTVRVGQKTAKASVQDTVFLLQSHFAEWEQDVLATAQFIAERHDLSQALVAGDDNLVRAIALQRVNILGLDNVDVVDASGRFSAELHQASGLEYRGEDALLQRALQGETVLAVLIAPDGTGSLPRYLLSAVSPVRDAHGQIIGAVLCGKGIDGQRLDALKFARSDVHIALSYGDIFLLDENEGRSAVLRARLTDRARIQRALAEDKVIYQPLPRLPMLAPYTSAYIPLHVGDDGNTVLAIALDMHTFIGYGLSTGLSFAAVLILALLLLSSVLSVSLRRTIVKPLMVLDEAVTAMAAGDYRSDVPVLSSGAVGRLAQNFNHMAAAIRARNAQLREFNRTLEARVAERTAEARRMMAAVQAAANGVVITDVQGIIQWVNPAFTRLTGYSAEEAIGRSTNILKSGLQPTRFYQRMWATIEQGEVWSGEVVNRRKDGSLYVEHMSIAPVLDEQGRIQNYIAIKEDVTERRRLLDELKQAREQAEAANQAKSQFLANMSHEFRTPLTAIIGYSELLEEDARDMGDDALLSDIQKIRQAGEHLTSLVNTVLDLAKIEAGYMELDLHTFSVDGMLRAVIATTEPLFIKNSNRLEVETTAGLGEITADPTKTRQILINLLGNATKFTRQGIITLRTRRFADQDGQEWVEFQVQDTGIGMTEEQLAHVFDEFAQADLSITREFGGTGLGLSVSKHYCEMMGGHISAESTPGAGSTFTVRIPARVPEDQDA